MTPLEKHIQALEAELELQLTERNPAASTDVVRAAIQALPKVIDFFSTSPRIQTEGEQAVLRLPNGMDISFWPDGTCTLRREGRQDQEYPTLSGFLTDPELLREMRDQRRPYFEVRPFTGRSELLDEIVASPARVSIRRNGKAEYLIRVNGHGFRMSNRGPKGGNEDQLPALLFQLFDPEHMPRDGSTVEHTADPIRPGTLEGLEGLRYLAPHRADAPPGLLGRNRQWKLFLHPREAGRAPIAADSPVREGDQCALRGIEGQSSQGRPAAEKFMALARRHRRKQGRTTPTRGDRPRTS